MIRRAVVLLLLLAACRQESGPATTASAPLPPPEEFPIFKALRDQDGGNLLTIANGGSVVRRDGEANLFSSAAHLIDGMALSAWISPPGARHETMIFSLGAPSHIRRLGAITASDASNVPQEIAFDTSMDGRHWTPAAGIPLKAGTEPQLVDIGGVDARFIRFSVSDPTRWYTHLFSMIALGNENGPPSPSRPAGCWSVNGDSAWLTAEGNHLWGRVGGRTDVVVEGAVAERNARVMWIQGPTWGYALLSTTPDGEELTGITWFEEVNAMSLGPAWFGARSPACDQDVPRPVDTVSALLQRAGRWSMFGLVFDHDRLLVPPSRPTIELLSAVLAREPSQRFRVVAHEFDSPREEDNRRRTDARIASLRSALQSAGVDVGRMEFVSAGSASMGAPVIYAPQRLLASRVDLERVR